MSESMVPRATGRAAAGRTIENYRKLEDEIDELRVEIRRLRDENENLGGAFG